MEGMLAFFSGWKWGPSSEWVVNEKTDGTIMCRWCKKGGISYANQGVLQIKQHAMGIKRRGWKKLRREEMPLRKSW